MARTSLREAMETLKSQNDKLTHTLVKIRDIAEAGHLLANRWSIIAAVNTCLTEIETGLPTLETLMIRDGLLPPILPDCTDDNGEAPHA